MGKAEGVLFWLAVFTYTFSFLVYLAMSIFKREKWSIYGWSLLLGAFTFHSLSIATRWVETGHPPVMGRFENNLAGAWFVILIIFALNRWLKRTNLFGLFLIPLALIMLGVGVMATPELQPLSPPFKSNWLWIHVIFAWFAYSSFAAAGGLGFVYLLKERAPAEGEKTVILRLFPQLALLDDILLKFISFGFISQTLMLIAGSIWANGLWGSYWSWDLIETWSLVTWLAYGIILHFRLTLGWKGRRIAWLALAALFTVIITFWGIGFISKLHTPLLG